MHETHTALKLVTASTSDPVSVAEAKNWLRLPQSFITDDDAISRLIKTATKRIEDEAGRCFLKQTFEWYLDAFPCDDEALRPPRAPLSAVNSIKYFTDTDGPTDTGGRTMNSTEYIVDKESEPGRIVPFDGYSWPNGTRVARAGIIGFDAGESSQASGVAQESKDTVLALVAYLYEHRGEELERDAEGRFALPPDVLVRIQALDLPEWG